MATDIDGFYNQLSDALKQRVNDLGDDASAQDLSKLLTEIRAMRMVVEQLTHLPNEDRETQLVKALSTLTRELAR